MEVAFKPIGTGQHQHRFRLLTLLGILVGFGLRLYRLGAESLWYDETVSVVLAQKSIPALLRHTAGDIHPPGYYLLLHGWQALTHPTPAFGLEFLYAWPSLWFGVMVMVLILALGRSMGTPRVALLALWLAALNPYHIWYSQEVRMYTLGALLGLLSLWAMLQWWCMQPSTTAAPYRWLGVYVVAGASGLYTLYYFLFALLALNGIALWLWIGQRQPVARRVGPWLGAHVAIGLLWAPWLPIFWRQVTTPPVPPWRAPWTTGSQFFTAMAESAGALLNGQSTPAPATWFWLFLFGVVVLCAHLYYTNNNHRDKPITGRPWRISPRVGYFVLLASLLIPPLLLATITWWVTPLYHVRYLFTYAPPLMILLAAALAYVYSRQRLLGVVGTASLLLLHSWSLYQFWFTPTFQADDHRAAVAQVAQSWRPGDLILVNAGWVYTALTTYWPTELVGVDTALPPPLQPLIRLIDYPALQPQTTTLDNPLVVRTGSIDGTAALGWGDPASDFFAISAATTTAALTTMAQDYSRLWHYRLYDTVNDPQGSIRTWLTTNNTLVTDTPIPGRDYLRVQLYAQRPSAVTSVTTIPLLRQPSRFAGGLQLQQAALTAPTVTAGAYLYTQLTWQPPAQPTQLPAVISFSLRLYTADGQLLTQADETPLAIQAWPTPYVYTMALPIPVATPPGMHQLVLIAYDQQSGAPLAVEGTAPQRQDMLLGTVQVKPATQAPRVTAVQATFDYIDLVRARISTATPTPGTPLELELVWRPHENSYRDTYIGEVRLVAADGTVVEQWESALGGWNYPSGIWPFLLPVRDWRSLPIASTTAPGQYTLVLRVLRDSDKQLIPASRGWWQSRVDELVIDTVAVQ